MMSYEGVQQIFSQIASRIREKTAIEYASQKVTYGELEDRSNSLANFLISSGARKGSIIAILAQDSIRVITAIIGVLKAGCAFVPLDPSLPNKRLEAMVSLTSPDWFIVESQFLDRLELIAAENVPNARVACFDGNPTAMELKGMSVAQGFAEYLNSDKPEVESGPDDMCYVYFTSGSTGTPKAIAGRLSAIDHFIRWETKTLGLGGGTRVSHLLAPSFDGSLRDIFVPLCSGGTVCIPAEKEIILDASQLVRWIDGQRINIIHCVPSLFRSLANEDLRENHFEQLRYILMAGEPLLPADVSRWMQVFGERVQLVNLYGPTETTMVKFFYLVTAGDKDKRTIPVGKPIEGAAAIVLNDRGKPCPPGMIGEIYIRTAYRSLGYYNQPELTNELFMQNPFSDDPDDIVYKTGDVGRILPDGNFEFLGRRDQQVKIRGVRIETGEIENVLRRHAGVMDVAVVARDDAKAEKYLCAYVVLDKASDTNELREHVAEFLPENMIPTVFVEMEELPRTISGKIDRRALPEPWEGRVGLDQEYIAPRTAIEEVVAGIWREVLGITRVGIYDNFFHLGGHSLRATQVLSRTRAVLKVEIPLRTLFKTPTVAGIAEAAEAAMRADAGSGSEAPAIKRIPRDGNLPLSFAQQRLWLLDQLVPGNPYFNIPAAIRLTGSLNVAALKLSFNDVIRRHETLRSSFIAFDGQPLQRISQNVALKLPLIDLQSLPDDEREREASRLANEQARQSFDLSEGPLLRIRLLRLDSQEHAVLLTIHHIISDGWSMSILIREVATLYDAHINEKAAALPELNVQYVDFAHWQRQWLQGEVLKEKLEYWNEQLSGAPAALSLPSDHSRPESPLFKRGRQPVVLPTALANDIASLCRAESVTSFMILLAAYQILLHHHCGQDDIVVGSPIANRNRTELENLIGLFINTMVLRTRFAGNPTFKEVLGQVKEATLGAYAHQDLPFEKLVSELQPERASNRLPLFQVWLVLQNTPVSTIDLPSLTLRPMPIDHETGHFDLSLNLSESVDGLRGSFEYNADLFEPGTIVEMISNLEGILGTVVMQPEITVDVLKAKLVDPFKQRRQLKQDQFKETRRKRLEAIKLKHLGVVELEESPGL